MPFSNADLLAIKAELTNDPKDLGLTLLEADDASNANKLNAVSASTPIDRETIPVSDIAKAIDRDEFNALSAADRQWIQMITASGSVNPQAGGEVREGLLQAFGAGTESRTSLTALLTEPASRINQMFKEGLLSQGGSVSPSDISAARAAT